MKRISFAELTNEVSEVTGMPVSDIKVVTETVFDVIRKHMLLGNSVLIWRFGVFSLKKRRARRSHNICLNHVVEKPSKDYPKLKFSRNFMDN